MPSILATKILFLQLLLLFFDQFSRTSRNHIFVDAALPCSDDSFCEQMIRPGSYCIKEQDTESSITQGVCSNPFTQGCLQTLLPEKLNSSDAVDELRSRIRNYHTILEGRICNSDDVDSSDKKQCKIPFFEYPEIRIHNGNWETSIFLSWIYQIILMEILEVPVAIGIGPSGVGHGSGIQDNTYDASFYNPYNTISFSSKAYPWDALKIANEIEDCNDLKETIEYEETDVFSTTSTATRVRTTAQPCAHVLPEVWNGQVEEWNNASKEGYIDHIVVNGQVGKADWYIPRYTASEYDNTLASFHGLRGEENRHKLAAAFKRPLQWKYYCDNISTTNCTEPDTIATRYPISEEEQSSYFTESAYTGYFHFSDENNCTKNPTTCTGIFIGPECSWSMNVEAQIYWNNIVGLEQAGPLKPNGGYHPISMMQIWRAANATKSNVMMWWWKPDPLIEEFYNTSNEFQSVILPEPTKECANARVHKTSRCSADVNERRGFQDSGCGQEAHTLYKVFARSLKKLSSRKFREQESNLADRSPGYTTIKKIRISDIEMSDMLRERIDVSKDLDGYNARKTVCSWVVNNLEELLDAIPNEYPRKLDRDESYYDGYRYTAMVIAICANILVWMTLGATYYYRKKRVMIFAQVHFLITIIVGYGIISIAAIVVIRQPPTSLSCTIGEWLVALGYTIELVPVLVKVSAINKIMQSTKKTKQVYVSQKTMAQVVVFVVLVVVSFLIVWTILDPLYAFEYHTIETEPSSRDVESLDLQSNTSNLVYSHVKCNSQHYSVWANIILSSQGILLVMTSILAFQSRNVQQEFNESRMLGVMIYSHSIFLILRIMVTVMGEPSGEMLSSTMVAIALSFLYSFDTLAALLIHIFPTVRKAAVLTDTVQERVYRNSVWKRAFGHSLAIRSIRKSLDLKPGSSSYRRSDGEISESFPTEQTEKERHGINERHEPRKTRQ